MALGGFQCNATLELRGGCRFSEAGSGKTAEIRNVSRQLRSEGKSAFFLRIEYVREFLEGAFEEGTKSA